MISRPAVALAVAAATLFAVVTIAGADHSWNGYHWPSDKLAPTVVSKTSSSLYDVPAAVAEWANLGTPISPTLVGGRKGDIAVSEGFSPFWLGLARVFVEGGHITSAEVKLNTRLLKSYGAAVADHVLCQELGHVLGLDHNRDGAIGGSPDNSCMNDQGHLGQYSAPNGHDIEQLNAIYSHLDSAGGANPASAPGGNGVWITVHVFTAR